MKLLQTQTYIAQGEHATGSDEDAIISTILGSCVAVCLWDPVAKLGGMNHILLPGNSEREEPKGADQCTRIGAFAMETLINDLIHKGGEKARLRAKVFGGAAVVEGLSNIGAQNAEFVLGFLAREGIPLDAQSVGGKLARQVRFWPATGLARQRFVKASADIERRPEKPKSVENDVELF